MAIVVIGVIAIVGYSAIKNVLTKSCDSEKITFKTDLEAMIEKYTSYGSVNKRVLPAPCDYEEICFVDSSKIGKSEPISCSNNKIISDSVENNVEQNIFVISEKKTLGIGYSELVSLETPNECECIKRRNNNFYLTFDGLGATTKLSQTET